MAEKPAPEPSQPELRLRVFAGPNGSGKSSIIQSVRETVVYGKPIDFGYYINADDIARALRTGQFSFTEFDIAVTKKEILDFAEPSGLLNKDFTIEDLDNSFSLRSGMLRVKDKAQVEKVAQIVARHLREALFAARRRFSFETVFSHESNIDIMRRAAEAGYKVYLYFVATEFPEINQYRVALRVKKGGHHVPPDKVEQRYFRSLDLLYEAAQTAYQAFFFDNSIDDEPYRLVEHFKMSGEERVWDQTDQSTWTNWFKKYYVAKDAGK
ncbi:MAG: zeta toxin family protein [Bacteroidetes bacterium]|nr:zeta toxin family protein [Bacteroidota bacterium]